MSDLIQVIVAAVGAIVIGAFVLYDCIDESELPVRSLLREGVGFAIFVATKGLWWPKCLAPRE